VPRQPPLYGLCQSMAPARPAQVDAREIVSRVKSPARTKRPAGAIGALAENHRVVPTSMSHRGRFSTPHKISRFGQGTKNRTNAAARPGPPMPNCPLGGPKPPTTPRRGPDPEKLTGLARVTAGREFYAKATRGLSVSAAYGPGIVKNGRRVLWELNAGRLNDGTRRGFRARLMIFGSAAIDPTMRKFPIRGDRGGQAWGWVPMPPVRKLVDGKVCGRTSAELQICGTVSKSPPFHRRLQRQKRGVLARKPKDAAMSASSVALGGMKRRNSLPNFFKRVHPAGGIDGNRGGAASGVGPGRAAPAFITP